MSEAIISQIRAIEILDSRGNPTIETEVVLSDGSSGVAAVPSGASTGMKEALELRDNDESRYLGKGVLNAVSNVNLQISNLLRGSSPFDQSTIDNKMIEFDGTQDKSRLGANSILSVSLAVALAAANSRQIPLYQYLGNDESVVLPVPYFNILNGGAHANNDVDIQEYMIVPLNFSSFKEALRCGVEVYHHLKKILDERGMSTAVGDEGGFAPDFKSNTLPLNCINEAILRAGYDPSSEVGIALDVASSELHKGSGSYSLSSEGRILSNSQFIDYLASLVDKFNIISIEDGLAENDWNGWSELTSCIGDKIQLVGDDIFVTNSEILQNGIDDNIANAILIKLNQVGTVTETLKTVQTAQNAGYGVMISHRSGETENSAIADLAVATAAGQIKTGAPCRSERTVKYNRLLRIEDRCAERAIYHKLSWTRG